MKHIRTRALSCAFVCILALSFAAATSAWAASPHLSSPSGKTCGTCHAPHTATTKTGLFRDTGGPSGERAVCIVCHDGSGASGNVVSGQDAFDLGSGHVLEGLSDTTTPTDLTNACSDCHKPHGDPATRRKLPATSVNGLAIGAAGNPWCLACHNDSQAWYERKGTYPALSAPSRDASGYPVAGTFPGSAVYANASKNAHVRIPASSGENTRTAGDCLYCHAAHGSAGRYDSLLTTFAPSTAASAANDRATGSYAASCFACHGGGEWVAAGAVDIKRYVTHEATDTGIGASGGHRIKSPGASLPVNAPLPCYDCHNPHGSSRGNSSLIADELGASLVTTAGPEGVRRFCLACHTSADGFGWNSDTAGWTAVAASATVEGLLRTGGAAGSGPDGGQNWLRLRSTSGHGRADVSMSCYDCHGGSYATASSNNVHDPATYTSTSHTGNPTAASIAILGTSYGPYACSKCHDVELGPEHAKSTSVNHSAGCSECHPSPRSTLAPWNKSTCAQGGCHTVSSTQPMHGTADLDHSTGSGACGLTGCHPGGTSAAAIHSAATTTVAGQTRASCDICHPVSATPTLDCLTCHTAAHPAQNARHTSTNGYDYMYATHSDGEYMYCSDCHTLSLLPLHANYCAVCHADSARAAVKTAIANNQTGCMACHPTQHYGNVDAHDQMYAYSDMNCGSCHGPGCTVCHGAWTPVPDPHTTSDAIAAYIGGAVINLSATDGVNGSFGIKQTYHTLDGGAAATGTAISVSAPATGTASHTIAFWSTDWSGKTEAPHSATFTISRDTTPPVTTSNALASYGGTATITFTATDDSRDFGVAATIWRIDGGAITTGGVAVVPRTPSGTATHTVEFRSVDQSGNWETTKSVTLSITRDLIAPTTTVTVPQYTRYQWNYHNFTITDPAPSSGITAVYLTTTDPGIAVYGSGVPYNGATGYQLYAPSQGTHWFTYWGADNEGNAEAKRTATYTADWTVPTTTSDAQASYTGTATVLLTPTDTYSGIAATYWRTLRSGSYSAWSTGTTATIPPPASGSVSVTLFYYSKDGAGNIAGSTSKILTVNAPSATFTLTYTAGANGSISGTSPQTVTSGGAGTAVTAVGNTGYHFVSWSDGSTANPRTDTNVTAAKSVTASFAINTYTLTYTAGANGTIIGTSPQTVAHGGSGTTVTAAANSGYHFVKWSDESTANPRTDTNVTANGSVTASFAPNPEYTLTYSTGPNGSVVGTSPQTVLQGASGTAVTAVPSTGYHFVKWSDESTANPRTDTNVTGNVGVTAEFVINTYTLTYSAGTNGALLGNNVQLVNHGGTGSAVTAVPDVGYHFVKWSDESTANPRTDAGVTGSSLISARFVSDTGYTLTYVAGANGTLSGSVVQTVPDGESGSAVTAVADTGYRFVNWSDGNTANPRTDTNVSANVTVTANFAVQTFQVYSTNYSGGTISPLGYTNVGFGASQTYTVTPTSGNRVACFSIDGDYTNGWRLPASSYTFTNVTTSGHSIYAYFAGSGTRTLIYTYSPFGYTSAYTTPRYVTYGASGPSVTAYPYYGYHFVNWSDGGTANPRTDTNVTEDKIITPNFAPNTYTLTYAQSGNGTLAGATTQSLLHGSTGTTVTAVPNAGYRFLAWSDGVLTAARKDTATGNMSVSASFSAVGRYQLIYTSDSEGQLSGAWAQAVSPGGNGTAVSAGAYDTNHWVFDYWSDEDGNISYANPLTDTNVTEDKHWVAHYWNYYTGSCPFLFTWDGLGFRFEADLFSTSKLGAVRSSGTYQKPNPHDYYVLENVPVAKDEKLEMRLVEERAETDYLDTFKLFAVDVPTGRDLAAEKIIQGGTYEPLQDVVHSVSAQLRSLRAIHVQDGTDFTQELAAPDGAYATLNPDKEQPAYQTIEFDLGDLTDAPAIKLVCEGNAWLPETEAGKAIAAGIPTSARQKVEVIGTDGNWTALSGSWPKPAEFARPYLLDLTGRFPTHDYRVRLTFVFKTCLDAVRLDTTTDVPLQVSEVPLASGTLEHHGFDLHSTPGDIFEYVYGPSTLSRAYLPGLYTRFGDVTPLLGEVDDKFVIFGGGDEVTMRFAPPAAPDEGMTRRYVVYTNGYYKWANTDIAHTVDPLPFAAMSNYPYTSSEHYPDDADHEQYRTDWNTRYEDGF